MAATPDTETGGKGIARKLIVPAAISAAGSAVGLLLTQRQKVTEVAPKIRDAVSDLAVPRSDRGVGELTGDLRDKVEEVLGKTPASDAGEQSTTKSRIDRSELEQRRRARQERREQRRQSSRR